MISASGPWPWPTGPAARMREKAGARKPSVLPLPVRAIATMSAPDSAHGQACAWMGEGAANPAPLHTALSRSSNGPSSKVWKGSGREELVLAIWCFFR